MYTIDKNKLQAVIRIVNNETDPTATDELIEQFVTADWHEGDEHQEWLNEADAQEIADWIAACVYN